MSKLLERWKREKAEREARQLEREKKRAEREKEKLRIKREKHHKKMRHKQNQRYYKKKRSAFLKEKAKIGDERGCFSVYIMKNRKKIKKVGTAKWKTDAYAIFNEAIEQNRKEVSYPLMVYDRGNLSKKVEHEIIIVQKVRPEDDIIAHFRNEDGRFIEHEIVDKSGYKIIDKAEWLIEETFTVQGYHPTKDRKTFRFILDEMVLKDISRETSRMVFVHCDKVIIRNDSTLDTITCKNNKEAERLYDALYKAVDGNKYIVFTGRCPRDMSAWVKENLEEITGRKRK